MGKLKIKGSDLRKIGFENDISRSMAILILQKDCKHWKKQEAIDKLIEIKTSPEFFLGDKIWNKLASTFIQKKIEKEFSVFELDNISKPLKIYGANEIDDAAKKQLDVAMQLPISKLGALMPDAHHGYGLPIGGVLATYDAIIPYGVGVDIGCRMALSIFDVNENFLNQYDYQLKCAIRENTHFGMDGGLEKKSEHEVLDRNMFYDFELLRKLHGKAYRQLGSSGGGNHFVEFGIVEIKENSVLGLNAGKYLGLLSHSGSRGLGATIANTYTDYALQTCKLPKQAQNFAWLDMKSDIGQEYWMMMNLAGDYATACHEVIHKNISKAMDLNVIRHISNHHNFAWKEIIHDEELIVHRKGATPAHEGELGIIPGSMTSNGYIVSGKGIVDSIYSASHGAGRAMSRSKAKTSITVSNLKKTITNAGVTLIGGSVEESPMVYKNIDQVMLHQESLVNIEGRFIPKIVRMNKE